MNPRLPEPEPDGVRVYCLRAFTSDSRGGNPAGVVLNADRLNPAQMQEIARIMAFSETAFFQTSRSADFRLRFFTPLMEVNLCGHATIAAYHCLRAKHGITGGEYTQELNAGILKVRVPDEGPVIMEQCPPVYGEPVDPEWLRPVLGAGIASQLDPAFPLITASTGLREIFIPVRSRAVLMALEPDFDAMKRLNRRTDTIGCHIYTGDTVLPENTCHCRNFAPAAGIPEEAATGSSSGALACLLARAGCAGPDQVFEQGHVMNSPSIIRVSLVLRDGGIHAVYVGGDACVTGEKRLCIS
ncbi:MAG TPA: PhzF family phenazine biosynthesis protein [bacterium]|nr:PhzF family phenazine biosynthesis protein [bacterium]